MKKQFTCFVVFGLLTATLHAQSYSVDWSKIAGGGGTSTSSVYSVGGTIGQHDAGGPMSGGTYSLTGGFWSLFAVQNPGAPYLGIFHTTTNTAVIYWAYPATGFSLQQNSSLSVTNGWVSPSETTTNNGTSNYIIVNPPVGTRFYRLIKP